MQSSLLYLNTPSKTLVDPPIEITKNTLPIDKLSWEDFEKLCLRMVQLDHSIDDCEIFGIPGQKQHGIDIFAMQDNSKYACYQCKKYEEVTTSTLTST